MMVVFANSKGGVGKSTLAVHLAVWLFDRGAKVALLDADRQLSASQWVAEVEPKITVSTANTAEEVLSEVRIQCRRKETDSHNADKARQNKRDC